MGTARTKQQLVSARFLPTKIHAVHCEREGSRQHESARDYTLQLHLENVSPLPSSPTDPAANFSGEK